MKGSVLSVTLFFVLIIASCTKDNTDNTISWTGTYNSSASPRAGINRVVISKVDNNSLQVLLQQDTLTYVQTVATVRKASIVNSTTFAVNETDTIAGTRDSTFNIVGTGALNGNILILSGSATNIATPSDVKQFYFSGSK